MGLSVGWGAVGGSCQGKTTDGVVRGCVSMVISRYVEVIGGVGVDEVA